MTMTDGRYTSLRPYLRSREQLSTMQVDEIILGNAAIRVQGSWQCLRFPALEVPDYF